MAVGNQPTFGGLNALLGDCAVSIRDNALQIQKLWGYVAALGANQTAQVAALVGLGFGSAANPVNPGNVSDAQFFWTTANYLFALSQFYYGQLATPAQFNYDSGLALVRGAS